MKPLIFLLSLTAASFCASAKTLPPGHPPVNPDHAKVMAPAQLPQKAKVTDVINVPQYTYLEVQQNGQSRWLAAPSAEVKKGDIVRFDNGMLMTDFHSNSLERTFPSITFINGVVVSQGQE